MKNLTFLLWFITTNVFGDIDPINRWENQQVELMREIEERELNETEDDQEDSFDIVEVMFFGYEDIDSLEQEIRNFVERYDAEVVDFYLSYQ